MKVITILLIASVTTANVDDLNFQCTPSGQRCIMPFTYEGKEYHECAITSSLMWCPTRAKPSGEYDISRCTVCEAPSVCYLRAAEFPSPSWKLDCPPGCANITGQLWTARSRKNIKENYYSVDSFVCAAAIREREINAVLGGTVTIQRIGNSLHEVFDRNSNSLFETTTEEKTAPLCAIQKASNDYSVPRLLFAGRKNIWVVNGGSPQVLVKQQKNVIAIDVDSIKNVLYWTDVEEKKIFRANLTAPSNPIQVMSSLQVQTPDGLAVDWVHGLLFWTDAALHTVSVSTDLGNHPKTLINREASYIPRAIAVDPKRGYMYVTDWGTDAKIERCDMTGEASCTTIVGHDITWPNGIALDIEQNLIYWVDARLSTISVATTDGEFRRELISSTKIVKHPYSLLVHEDRLYWTDWHRGILSISKETGQDVHLHVMDLTKPSGLTLYDKNRAKYPSRCQFSECKYLCLPHPLGARCACPDGYAQPRNDLTDCVRLPSLQDDENMVMSSFVESAENTFDAKNAFRRKKDSNAKKDWKEEL